MNALLESQRHEDARRREHGLIYGFDPSLTNFGFAVASDFRGSLEWVAVGSIAPLVLSKVKRDRDGISYTDDTRRRVGASARKLRDVIARHGKPVAICVEALALKRSSGKVFLALGRTRGLVDALCAEHDIEAHEYQPSDLKHAATGHQKAASKQEVIDAMCARYPDLARLLMQLDESNREHAADAAAAIHAFHAAPTTEEF